MASSALPQLNIADFETQIIWLLVVFTVFYYIIKNYIVPYFSVEIQNRENFILKNHNEAKHLQKKAERLADDYQIKTKDIYSLASTVVSDAKKSLSNQLEVEKKRLNDEMMVRFNENCVLIDNQLKQLEHDFLSHIDVLKKEAWQKISRNQQELGGLS